VTERGKIDHSVQRLILKLKFLKSAHTQNKVYTLDVLFL